MIQEDEDALICDFAETYQVYDYKRLPLTTAAVLAVGLRENSRIKMRINGLKASPDTLLQAAIVDRLSLILWATANKRRRDLPKSLLAELVEKKSDVSAFDSGKDFEEERQKLIAQMEE